jgi:hypothetical protein
MLCLERTAKSVCEIQAVEINFSYVSRCAPDQKKFKEEGKRKKLNGHRASG